MTNLGADFTALNIFITLFSGAQHVTIIKLLFTQTFK